MIKHTPSKAIYILLAALALSVFFGLYKYSQVPPCLNADEAAFGYNSYSLAKTAKDEYGNFMPLRLVSFRDYKLPLYSYLSMPFMALFGLNDFSTRLLNYILNPLFVLVVFFIAYELTRKKEIAAITSLLTALSPWMYILTRHAHEGPLSTFFILLSCLFLIRFHKSNRFQDFLFTNLSILLAAFSYHSARLFILIIITAQIRLLWKQVKHQNYQTFIPYVLVIAVAFLLPFFADLKYGVNRVQNLLFLKNPGFELRINEYMGEHSNRIIHNKGTEAIRDITYRYLSQISPEYLVVHGDTNWRFGFQNMGLITPIEYLFIFVGLYYLFFHKNPFRYAVIFFLALSALPNALTWQDASIIRSYIMVFPLLFIVAYGIYHMGLDLLHNRNKKLGFSILGLFVLPSLFFNYNNWDIYLNHYPKRAVVVRAWQCGYKQMTDYIKDNYNRFGRFIITDRHGQPYIFILHNLQYDPAKYQGQAKISAPDKYGFGQIDKFDKFEFKFHFDPAAKNTSFIGYPEDFNELHIDTTKIKIIKIGTEEIFWIYET